MKEYAKDAISILDDFPDSDAKDSLKSLVDYTMNREK